MSTILLVCGMDNAQNSILHDLSGAWIVCPKNSTKLNKPNFQLILIIGSLK